MKAYSVDLRQRVLAALERGMARPDVVTTFGVSLASIKRWLLLHRTGTALTPKLSSGRHRAIQPAQHPALEAQLTAHNDATVDEHTSLWNAAHGTQQSSRTLARAIARLGWTYKKRRWVLASATSRPGRPIAHTSNNVPLSSS